MSINPRDQLAARLDSLLGNSERDTAVRVFLAQEAAESLLSEGWRPPPRVIETPEAIAQERTGTVIRSRHGDVGSVDHGARGEWTGDSTVIHMLDFATAGRLYVGELHSDLASTFPWTVLHEPEEAR